MTKTESQKLPITPEQKMDVIKLRMDVINHMEKFGIASGKAFLLAMLYEIEKTTQKVKNNLTT